MKRLTPNVSSLQSVLFRSMIAPAVFVFCCVAAAAGQVSVVASANPSVYGQSVILTATVATVQGWGTPTGAVQFVIDGYNVGAPIALNGGSVTLAVPFLAVGPHTVVASYSGDTHYAPGSSALTGGQVVNRGLTGTALSSSDNPSIVGDWVTFTASVGVVSPAAGTPTGGVQFVIDGGNVGGPGVINGGTTSLTVSSLPVGPHTVAANYLGDTDYAGSSGSLAGGQVVTALPGSDTTPPTVSIASPADGQTFTTSSILVSGTALDPGSPSSGVVLVEVRVNSGSWQTATGTTDWSTTVSLAPGANQIDARSTDGAGNESSIASASANFSPPDTTPPSPSPSTWLTVPTATDTTSVHMVATTASDPSGVQYFFECVAGGGHDSGWQDELDLRRHRPGAKHDVQLPCADSGRVREPEHGRLVHAGVHHHPGAANLASAGLRRGCRRRLASRHSSIPSDDILAGTDEAPACMSGRSR